MDKPANRMVAYDVYLNKRNIDTVFYSRKCDGGAPINAKDVKESLVNHDGYNPNIVVIRSRR